MRSIAEICETEVAPESELVPEVVVDDRDAHVLAVGSATMLTTMPFEDAMPSTIAPSTSRLNARLSIPTFNGMTMDVGPSDARIDARVDVPLPIVASRSRNRRSFALGVAFVVVGVGLGAGSALAATGALALISRDAPPDEPRVTATMVPPSFPPALPLHPRAAIDLERTERADLRGSNGAAVTGPALRAVGSWKARPKDGRESSPAIATRAAAETSNTLSALLSAEERSRAEKK